MPKLCFGKSPSFATQNPGRPRGASSLDPMNLRRIIPTEEASHFPIHTGALGARAVSGELLRRSEIFSGRRFSFFKNNLFEKGKC